MLVQFWDALTFGHSFPDFCDCAKQAILVCGFIVILTQAVIGALRVDEHVSFGSSTYKKMRNSLYFYIIVVPLLCLVNSLELLLLIVTSFSEVAFTIACIIAGLSYIIKVIAALDGDDYSLFYLTRYVQTFGHFLIIKRDLYYPLQSVFRPFKATNRIAKKQRKHLI